jgi:hypothetical protein
LKGVAGGRFWIEIEPGGSDEDDRGGYLLAHVVE